MHNQDNKVTVSLSTTPRRISGILTTLESLFRQTRRPDVIRLNVPKVCHRLNEYLESVPDYLLELEKTTQLEIHITEDYGPATKFYPTCESIERDHNHFLIWLDDDIEYVDTLVEELVLTCPEGAAISATGFTLLPGHHKMELKHLCEVDILEGWGGVCCRTSDIPDLRPFWSLKPYNEMSLIEKCYWHSDDYAMSRALQDSGLKTIVHCNDRLNRFMNKPLDLGLQADALQYSTVTAGHHQAYSKLEHKRSFDNLVRELKGKGTSL